MVRECHKIEMMVGDELYKKYGKYSGKIDSCFRRLNNLRNKISKDIYRILSENPSTFDYFAFDKETNAFFIIEVKTGKSELTPKQKMLTKMLINMGVEMRLFYKRDLRSKEIMLDLNVFDWNNNLVSMHIRETLFYYLRDEWSYKRDCAYKARTITELLNELYKAKEELEISERKVERISNLIMFKHNKK